MNCFSRIPFPNDYVCQKLVLMTPSCVAGLSGAHSERTRPFPGMLKYGDIDTPYKMRGVRICVCWVLLSCSDGSAQCLSALSSARHVDGSAGGGGWQSPEASG